MIKPTRTALLLTSAVLVIAGCGDGEATDEPADSTIAANESGTSAPSDPTTTAVDETSADDVTTDTAPAQSGVPTPGASITVGDETYRYAVLDDGGSCDPEYLGIGFRALLTRIDESGAAVELVDEPGLTEGVTISLGPDGSGVIGGPRFTAGQDGNDSTSIDTVEFDGSRASGTATFAVTGADGTVEGSFELACDGG